MSQATGFTGFVLQKFDNAYDKKELEVAPLVAAMMDEWPTERPTETYSYLESVPDMGIWRPNESRESSSFRAVSWTTDTFDFQTKVEWQRNEDQDHQGREKISTRAQRAGETVVNTKIRIGTQMIEGAVDTRLLPAIPPAPDGAQMYATTASGSARFGATSGNLLTGTGVTGTNIGDDFFTAIEQFMLFQNTEGRPLWDPMILQQGVTIMFPVGLMKEFASAFTQTRPVVSNTAPTNIAQEWQTKFFDFFVPITPFMNPYLSDTADWYLFLNGSDTKPIYRGVQQALSHDVWDRGNSDRAKDRKIHAVGFDARWSHGIGPCFQTIKINN